MYIEVSQLSNIEWRGWEKLRIITVGLKGRYANISHFERETEYHFLDAQISSPIFNKHSNCS
jgi:hypothetical protein